MKRYNYAHERNEDHDENFQRIKRAPLPQLPGADSGDAARRKLGSARHPARKAGQEHRRAKRSDAQFG